MKHEGKKKENGETRKTKLDHRIILMNLRLLNLSQRYKLRQQRIELFTEKALYIKSGVFISSCESHSFYWKPLYGLRHGVN